MPVGVLWINQGPTETIDELIKRIPGEVPSAEVQRAEGELTLLTLAIPEAQASEGAARMMKSLILASLASGSHTPESVCNFISASFCCKRYCSAGSSRGTSAFVCCCALRSLSITFWSSCNTPAYGICIVHSRLDIHEDELDTDSDIQAFYFRKAMKPFYNYTKYAGELSPPIARQ